MKTQSVAQRRLLPDKFQEFPFDRIYIDCNWSDNRASIKVRGAWVDQPVNMLFAGSKAAASHEGPSYKRVKLMTLPCAPSLEQGLGELKGNGGEQVALEGSDTGLPELVSAETAASEVEAALAPV